ncbi:unnamed protein product [Closterium sp. NIES-54]
MFITLYFIVTHLPDSLRSVRDHFLSLDPTSLTVDLLEQHLLAAETSAVAVGAARGTPRPPFFEGCFPSPLAPSYDSAATADVSVAEDVGAASTSPKCRNSKGKGGKGGGSGNGDGGGGCGSGGGGSRGGGGGSGGGGGGGTGGGSGGSGGSDGGSGGSGGSGGGGTGGGRTGPRRGGPGGGQRQQQQRRSETHLPKQLHMREASHSTPLLLPPRQHHYTRYTTVFPLRRKGEVVDVLIPWIRTLRLQLRERFGQDLHSVRGGEFSSDLLREFCRGEGILQSFTLPASPQQNGISERCIGLVMEVARTSMIHAAAPHFLWQFAVRYAAQQLNLWPRISLTKTSPTLRWMGEVGDASMFRVWGSRAFDRDTSADEISARAIPYVFLGFVPDAPGWQFYHPTSRRVLPSQDVTFDEAVSFYHLFPYRAAPPPPPLLFLAPGPPPVDPLPPQGPAPSGVSQVDPLPGPAPIQVAVGSGAAQGAASGGVESGGVESRGIEPGGAEPRGAESEGTGSGGKEPGGEELGGAEPAGVEPGGAEPEGVEPGCAESEGAKSGGAKPRGAASSGDAGTGGAGVTARAGGTRGTAAAGPGAAGTGGVEGAGAGGAGVKAVAREALELHELELLTLEVEVLEALCNRDRRREPASRPVSLVRTAPCVPCSRPPPVPGTHAMALRPSSVPLSVPLTAPSESSLPEVPDPESYCARAVSPTVSRLLSTAVTYPSFESAAASALIAELLDFAAASRLDYATALVVDSEQEDFECLAAVVPRFASMLLAPERDPDAPDIPTPRSYAEAITGPYSTQWQSAMDAEMISWKSTGTYVNEVPPPGANIVDGMWIFRVKRPPGSPPAFKARYVARGFSERQGVDYFHIFSPTPKMTTLRVLLHVAAQRDYELHSLDFSTAFL